MRMISEMRMPMLYSCGTEIQTVMMMVRSCLAVLMTRRQDAHDAEEAQHAEVSEERAMDRQMDREEREMDKVGQMMEMGVPGSPFPPFGPGGPPPGAGAGENCVSSEAEDCHNLRCEPKRPR